MQLKCMEDHIMLELKKSIDFKNEYDYKLDHIIASITVIIGGIEY